MDKANVSRRKESRQSGCHSLIDLFAGCGGLSLGLEQAGFTTIFANEIWNSAATTYRMNRGLEENQVFVGDVIYLIEHLSDFKLPHEVTMVCGGPPCQGFSMANRQRVIDDPRNQLYKAYLKFLAQTRPLFFLMENVKGMVGRINEILDNFTSVLGDDYSLSYSLLNAADFGVPQNRERFILIGNRIGIDSQKVFLSLCSKKYKSFVLRDVLDGLPELGHKTHKGAPNEESDQVGYTRCRFDYLRNDFFKYINDEREVLYLLNHKNRYNNERDIEIYTRLPQGGNSLHPSIADIMPYSRRNGIFKDKFFKLEEDKICKTITSHMQFDCNMYIHPWYARGLTAREAARIQTFPDDYEFYGVQNSWYKQVGNAVPVKLAKAIGVAIQEWL